MAVSPKNPRQEISMEETAVVRAIHTRPDRLVLTTDGSSDAWMASDLYIELQQ